MANSYKAKRHKIDAKTDISWDYVWVPNFYDENLSWEILTLTYVHQKYSGFNFGEKSGDFKLEITLGYQIMKWFENDNQQQQSYILTELSREISFAAFANYI